MPQKKTQIRQKLQDANLDLPMRKEPLCHLTEAERERLRSVCAVVNVARGQRVYSKGERADSIFMVMSGKVKTTMDGLGERGLIVKMSGPLDTVGHRAALVGEKHTTTATAIEDATLIAIPRTEALAALRENIALNAFVIKTMARELRFCRERTVSLTQKQVRGRLAESLLTLKDKYGYAAGTKRINATVTREDMAALSNMTTANAIRTLAAFATEGLVTVSGREITIVDESGLEKTSRMG